MSEHRIDLQPNPKRHGPMFMFYNGKSIGSSNMPIFAAARWLLDNNAALPDDDIATYRGDTLSLSGKVGKMAKWAVQENEDGKPSLQFRKWKAFPAVGGAAKIDESAVDATTPSETEKGQPAVAPVHKIDV